MNCKEIEALLIDYQAGDLDEDTAASIEQHLRVCPACREAAEEAHLFLKKMEQVTPILPDRSIEVNFLQMLAEEKERLRPSSPPTLGATKAFGPFLRMAAAIALVVTCFGVGYLSSHFSLKKDLAQLEVEYVQLNKLITLALIEDESASKRLQAVGYAQASAGQDPEILALLIQKMNSDKLINIRLAAASALADFTEHDHVLDALITTLQQENNPIMQIELIQILMAKKVEQAIPIMQQLLNSTEVPAYIKEQIHTELAQSS